MGGVWAWEDGCCWGSITSAALQRWVGLTQAVGHVGDEWVMRSVLTCQARLMIWVMEMSGGLKAP